MDTMDAVSCILSDAIQSTESILSAELGEPHRAYKYHVRCGSDGHHNPATNAIAYTIKTRSLLNLPTCTTQPL